MTKCHIHRNVNVTILCCLIFFQESRADHLAEELGAAQAREMQLEARMHAEVKRLSAEIESLNQSYLTEVKTKLL